MSRALGVIVRIHAELLAFAQAMGAVAWQLHYLKLRLLLQAARHLRRGRRFVGAGDPPRRLPRKLKKRLTHTRSRR